MSGVADTRNQFRAEISLHSLGMTDARDIGNAVLFVSGLGGHRVSLNGRAVDAFTFRGHVTEWHLRTFYYADDVSSDVMGAVARPDGVLVVGVELFPHWYAIENDFFFRPAFPTPQGPRALRLVLRLLLTNGTTVPLAATCSGPGCVWSFAAGHVQYADLHQGQRTDARQATPGWQSPGYAPPAGVWLPAQAVLGPPGALTAHPMPRSRAVEAVAPVSVKPVDPLDARLTGPGPAYLFALENEVAGFCTVLLPPSCPAGTVVRLRHGETINVTSGNLAPSITLPNRTGAAGNTLVEDTAYTCSGSAGNLSAHDEAWRQLALQTVGLPPSTAGESFTPDFQYGGFKYVLVEGWPGSAAPPTAASLACYRVGAAFDWAGDVALQEDSADGVALQEDSADGVAARFNAVVAATRWTSISNFVFDCPTDCPTREKRCWMGDSLASHRAVAAFFDVRAAYTKWSDDVLLNQRLLTPTGTLPGISPGVFWAGTADPKAESWTDMAWASNGPLLSAFTVALTGDAELAARAAAGAGAMASLISRFANNASTSPASAVGLLNVTAWPGSRYGDWCPVTAPAGGCAAASSLLTAHHAILDADAAVALATAAAAGRAPDPASRTLALAAATARQSFLASFLTADPAGLAFNDPYPPRRVLVFNNSKPSMQTETASGMALLDAPAGRAMLADSQRAALASALAANLQPGASAPAAVDVGVIGASHLARALAAYGRPDSALALLSSAAYPGYFRQAAHSGTLWERWRGVNGTTGEYDYSGSLNHIMNGGSVGEAVFSIGGLASSATADAGLAPAPLGPERLLVRPLLWLSGAGSGAAAWRGIDGDVAAAWAVSAEPPATGEAAWAAWVNVSLPLLAGAANVSLTVPLGAGGTSGQGVFVADCGALDGGPVQTHVEDVRVAVGAAAEGGFVRRTASPPAGALPVPPPDARAQCRRVWPAPAAAGGLPGAAVWVPPRPGHTLFGSVDVVLPGGDYAFVITSSA